MHKLHFNHKSKSNYKHEHLILKSTRRTYSEMENNYRLRKTYFSSDVAC